MWSCSYCLVGLIAGLLSDRVSSLEIRARDGIHRIQKTHVTIVNDVLRRDDGESVSCPASQSLCPSSLGGGCCPDGYDCASESCHVATKAPQTCAGQVGYYACKPELGGGCCPEGYICKRGDNCVAPEGESHSENCPTSYFLCPSSLNYGCCKDGMGCAASACYSTEPSTYTVTRTITTTDSDDETITTTTEATTVSTPSAPTALPTDDLEDDDDSQIVLKVFPSSIPKVKPSILPADESEDDESGDGGALSTGEIAGVVVGAVALLVIIVVAAWLILRRLNTVARAVESSKATSKASEAMTKSQTTVQYRQVDKPTPSEIDDMSVDPYNMATPRPSHPRGADSDSDGTGLGLGTPAFDSPNPHAPGGGYHAVPTHNRQNSYDSAQGNNVVGYFDMVPDRTQRGSGQSSSNWGPGRVSVDSQGTTSLYQQQQQQQQYYAHGRHYSNASEGSYSEAPGDRPRPHELDSVNTTFTPELHGQSFSPVDYNSPTASMNDPRRHSTASNVSAMSSMTTTMYSSAPGPHVVGGSGSGNDGGGPPGQGVGAGAASAGAPAGGNRQQLSQARRRSTEGRGRSESASAAAVMAQGTLSVVTEVTEQSSVAGRSAAHTPQDGNTQ